MDTKIKGEFWSDPVIEGMGPAEKLAVLWLMTAHVNDAGWVSCSLRRFEFETGLTKEDLERACEGLGKGLVVHDKGWWLVNYIRHNVGQGEALTRNNMALAVVRAMRKMPMDLVPLVLENYPELEGLVKGLESPPVGVPKYRRGEERSARASGGRARSACAGGRQGGSDLFGEEEEGAEQEPEGPGDRVEVVPGSGLWVPASMSGEAREALAEWVAYKRERREGYKPRGWAALLKTLEGLPGGQVAATVRRSMAANWAGLFPDREAGMGGQKKEGGAGEGAGRSRDREPEWDWRRVLVGIAEGEGWTLPVELAWGDLPVEVRERVLRGTTDGH